MFLKTSIFLTLLFFNILILYIPKKLPYIIVLSILYLIIIWVRRYETFVSIENNEKIDNLINNDMVQNLLDKFLEERNCISLKRFKKIVYKITDTVSFIPKSKLFIKLFVTDSKIEDIFNKYCNKKNKLCKKQLEGIIISFLKKFLK